MEKYIWRGWNRMQNNIIRSSRDDEFLVDLLSPAVAILKKSVENIDNMCMSDIETELNIEVSHPTRPIDTRGGYSINDDCYYVETVAERNNRKDYLNKKYFTH